MMQGTSDRFWQAEARTEETKQFIRDIKRITRCTGIADNAQIIQERLFSCKAHIN